MFTRKSRVTSRFDRAFLLAHQLHARQLRKGSSIPYLAHLMGVASIVLEDGGDEDEAIAALLHDAVEDQGGLETLEDIRTQFGDRVARLVLELSDSTSSPKQPWRERKERYLQHLSQADESVLRVSLADKLHNARQLRVDLIRHGNGTWKRFNGGCQGSLWYYRSLVGVFQERYPSPYTDELAQVVADLERLGCEP